MSGDSVVVATYGTRSEAEMAAELLRGQGIESFLSLDDAGGAYPMLDLVRGVRIRVVPEDETRARELLEQHLAGEIADGDIDEDPADASGDSAEG